MKIMLFIVCFITFAFLQLITQRSYLACMTASCWRWRSFTRRHVLYWKTLRNGRGTGLSSRISRCEFKNMPLDLRLMFKNGCWCSVRIADSHCFIQRKAADPNRFSNRGGALLKESKDRAKVQKLLPKVHKQLLMFFITYGIILYIVFNILVKNIKLYLTNKNVRHLHIG